METIPDANLVQLAAGVLEHRHQQISDTVAQASDLSHF